MVIGVQPHASATSMGNELSSPHREPLGHDFLKEPNSVFHSLLECSELIQAEPAGLAVCSTVELSE